MKITVTGKLKEYSDGLTVKQLIEADWGWWKLL